MGILDRRYRRRLVPAEHGEVARTVTVRRAEPRDGSLGESSRDRTLDVGVGRADHFPDRGIGMSEQVVDVPVAGVALAGREFAVTLDAGEPARAERRPRVRVPPAVEGMLAEGAHFDRRGPVEFHE